MLKPYLQLVRIPGIFTAFSNILLGFFVSQETNIDWFSLGPLLLSSGFLYMAGMILNDYFDYETDKNERPTRPLPSGQISKKKALVLGTMFLIFANISLSLVEIQSLFLSLMMTGLILGYNIKAKKIPLLGISNLASIRFLNVILGATAVSLSLEIVLIAIPIAIFVAAISVLGRTETIFTTKKTTIPNTLLILATITYIAVISLNTAKYEHLIFLGLFIVAVFLPTFIYKEKTITSIQKKVTFQLLALVILDATLLSAFSEISYAILCLSLYIPAYAIAHKMYLT